MLKTACRERRKGRRFGCGGGWGGVEGVGHARPLPWDLFIRQTDAGSQGGGSGRRAGGQPQTHPQLSLSTAGPPGHVRARFIGEDYAGGCYNVQQAVDRRCERCRHHDGARALSGWQPPTQRSERRTGCECANAHAAGASFSPQRRYRRCAVAGAANQPPPPVFQSCRPRGLSHLFCCIGGKVCKP